MALRIAAQNAVLTAASGITGGVATLLGWFRLDADRNTYTGILSLFSGGTVNLSLSTENDGTSLYLYDTAFSNTIGPHALTVGTWYRYAVVVNAGAWALHIGAAGAALTTYSATGRTAISSPTSLAIGHGGVAAEWTDGSHAADKHYQAALTLAEIETELAQYQPGRTDNLVRYHPFLVSELVDYSGNARTLTAGSTAATTTDGPPLRWARARGPRVKTSGIAPQSVTATGIASGETFGSATVSPGAVATAPAGIGSEEAFGSARLDLAVTVTGIVSAEEFGTAAVVPAGAAAPAGITSAEAFGAPTLTTTAVAVAVAGIASGEAFGAPLLALTVTATGIASGEAIGAPTVAAGAVTAAPTSIASGEVFGLAALTAGAVAVAAAGIGSAEDVPAPRVSLTIYPVGVASAAAFGSSALTVGAITITAVGIASGEAFGSPQVGVTLDPGLRTGRPQRRLHVTYELVCVRRIPQSAGPPAFLEVDPIEWSTLTWSSTLSRPQTLTAVCPVASITEPVRQQLRAPDRLPTELWLLRDGQRVCAGPLMGGRRSGDEVTLEVSGLLAYLGYWIVESDKRFDQVDQFSIAAWLVDQWQTLEYGHFGIDTSTVGASGKLRDRSYIRDEINPVGRRLEELGAVTDGFDAEVDPVTRKLQLWYPGKGVDRSSGADAVVFDDRVITSPETMFSIAPGDLASDAYGTATASGADSALWSARTNAELRATFGRAAVTGSWSGVSEQATLDDHTSALLNARDQALFVPGPSMRVTPDADLSDYDVGDTVAVEMDSTLGLAGSFRIRKRTVRVAKTGAESVDLEFV